MERKKSQGYRKTQRRTLHNNKENNLISGYNSSKELCNKYRTPKYVKQNLMDIRGDQKKYSHSQGFYHPIDFNG